MNSETTQHFLLKCHIFNVCRLNLFENVNPILIANNLQNLNDSEMVSLLLYGHVKLPFLSNQTILKATISYIEKTYRFPQIEDS